MPATAQPLAPHDAGTHAPVHGGPDALGVPAHDLSTNTNACGPWPPVAQAVQQADARHYPDPAYTALAVQLAAWHHVAPERIVPAASGSELIQRLSVALALGARAGGDQPMPAVWLPPHAYGDYARAAQAAGLPQVAEPARAALQWACDPSSPLGEPHAQLAEQVAALQPWQSLVLDQAYEPLRLHGALALSAAALDRVWRLITPNKALGLTGVRAAYAIAPRRAVAVDSMDEPNVEMHADAALLARVRALAPSWPLGAHGVALLQHWASVPAHDWLHECRHTLRAWKARQTDLLTAAGWRVQAGQASFLVASAPPSAAPPAHWLPALRAQGFKLRDCASFGLPGHVRMAVAPPPVQDALMQALKSIEHIVFGVERSALSVERENSCFDSEL